MDAVTRLRTHRIEARQDGDDWLVDIDGRRQRVAVAREGAVWSFLIASGSADRHASRRSHQVSVDARSAGDLVVHVDGQPIPVGLPALHQRTGQRGDSQSSGRSGPQHIVAPMPGRVVSMLVRSGDMVAERQAIVVIEAMKMQNELRATRAGTVSEVRVTEGALVDAGALLVVMLPDANPGR